MSYLVPWALAVAALLAACCGDWTLRRAARRLPRLFGRSRNSPSAFGERALRLALSPVRLAIWLLAFDTAAAQFPALRMELLSDFADGLWTPLFDIRGRVYTTLDFVLFPLALLSAWAAIRLFTHFFLRSVLASAGVAHGVREAIALLVRYSLIGAAGMALLQLWGFDVSNLALVASVLGVGIGFGLQNIANNFISGLVISLERPIQLGDFIRVGEWTGTVEHIGARCVEITTTDRVSILVPNSRLLEGEVVNWTHRDPRARLRVPVRVAYGSDIPKLRLALLDAARGHPGILGEPPPDIALEGFDENALDCALLVWTREPQRQERLKSDLNYRIEASLRKHGVEVPPPHQDLLLQAPQLDELLQTLGGRATSDTRPNETQPTAAPAAGAAIDASLPPRAWSPTQLDEVADMMHRADGIPVRDRRHLLSTYPRAFVGSEAVDWMCNRFGLRRPDAVDLGQLLLELGHLRHVQDDQPFRDDRLLYRFRRDE